MIPVNSIKIVNTENGPYTGDVIYIDQYGRKWVPTLSTKESCSTGETVGNRIDDTIYFY